MIRHRFAQHPVNVNTLPEYFILIFFVVQRNQGLPPRLRNNITLIITLVRETREAVCSRFTGSDTEPQVLSDSSATVYSQWTLNTAESQASAQSVCSVKDHAVWEE